MDDDILAVLAANPGVDKREISRRLKAMGHSAADPSRVNSRLYALLKLGRVVKIGETPPHWSLASTLLPPPVRQVSSGSPPAAPRLRVTPRRTFERSGAELRQWQREALDAWERAGRVGVVEAVTGTGKTQVGLEAAHGHLETGGKVLVVVPTRALLNQWDRVLVQAFGERRVGRRGDKHADSLVSHDVVVSTIQSARGIGPAGRPGLIVADECHRYGAPAWFGALDEGFEARLGLTATLERGDEGDELLRSYFQGGPVFGIDYRRAIKEGAGAPFRMAFVGVRLAPDERRDYEDSDRLCRKARAELVGGHGLDAEPFATFMRQVVSASKGEWSPDSIRPARLYISGFARRRAVVADSRGKLDRLAQLEPLLSGTNGTLIFTQTKDAAVRAASLLGDLGHSTAAIFGDLDGGEREGLLAAFRDRERTVLTAPRVLDEGIDVPEADLGIILSASQSKRQMIQRMGRTLRLKSDGRDARLVVLFADGTSEDPASGAHEGFMEMAWDVATEKRIFRPSAPAVELLEFLRVRGGQTLPPKPLVRSLEFAPRSATVSPPRRKSSRTVPRRSNACSVCHLPLRYDGRCEFCG